MMGPEALKLPARERALLAESLWESIEDPFQLSLERSDETAIALAMKRDAEVEPGSERWMIAKGDIRRALMSRFPYVIYFRIQPQNAIRITVVKHQKRHPRFGQDRR